MSELTHSGDRVVAALERLRRTEVLSRLLPGMREEEIERRLSDAGVPGADVLIELYAWRGGTVVETGTTLGDVQFFPGYWFLSLEEALEQYATRRQSDRWNDSWFPVFANGGGDYYAVWLGRSPSPVVDYTHDSDERPLAYPSLPKMMTTLAACFEQGVIFVDDEGYLDMDYAKHEEVAREVADA